LQPADTPPPQLATLGFHPVARRPLFISHSTEDRRLSWPEHSIGYSNVLKMIRTTPLKYAVDDSYTRRKVGAGSGPGATSRERVQQVLNYKGKGKGRNIAL